jgi:hypothetical protein
MSDTQTVDPGTTDEQVEAVTGMEPAEKPVKVDPTKDCLCGNFEVFDPKDEDSVFNTGCNQTTKRQFAQGHDARLVSFLVGGVADGYSLRMVKDGVSQSFATPEDAARTASEALAQKAKLATENMQAKSAAKESKAAERATAKQAKAAEKAEALRLKAEAKERAAAEKAEAKAAKPQAEVAAGSGEGDGVPTPEGQTKIKVGRWEYNAVVDADGVAHFTDGKGDEQSIERDGYRVL